jgi:hypothetical protein
MTDNTSYNTDMHLMCEYCRIQPFTKVKTYHWKSFNVCNDCFEKCDWCHTKQPHCKNYDSLGYNCEELPENLAMFQSPNIIICKKCIQRVKKEFDIPTDANCDCCGRYDYSVKEGYIGIKLCGLCECHRSWMEFRESSDRDMW